ncbi:hypothetical protein [Paraburkholderia diazotrophica]|uniref:hypothetical protein n=1 Tax=Paraburkholderia diazotrophica TaxID=667676 RepID=UPI0031816964
MGHRTPGRRRRWCPPVGKTRGLQYSPTKLAHELENFIARYCKFDGAMGTGALIVGVARNSIYSQAFWLRNGALYEPTAALHQLLDASDVAADVPLGQLRLPTPALCIVPEPSMQQRSDGFESMLVFEHGNTKHGLPSERWLTCVVWHKDPISSHSALIEYVRIDASDSTTSIRQAVMQLPGLSPNQQKLWQQWLDYVIKMLLYLSLDSVRITHERPYTTAPRTFAGLGKRKRSQRLAAIEQLYDRYVIGPPALTGDLACRGTGSGDHEVRAHWRRGHFRMQPYGPAATQRKLIFVMPTLVRADRLASGNDG